MIKAEALWPALLQAREHILRCRETTVHPRSWGFVRHSGGEWQFESATRAGSWSLSENRISCDLDTPRPADWPAKLGLVSRYLDLLLAQASAERSNSRVRTLASFAQSLDGFIATKSGDSQWIGNEANLVHAHRLRALHDAILVGRNTLVVDKPRLSVRKVTGRSPIRVVLTRRSGLNGEFLDALHAPTLVLAPQDESGESELSAHAAVTICQVGETLECGHLNPQAVLEQLQTLGIRSLMIEGGGKTASLFLGHGALDEADIHIAPIWLGDGVKPFLVPAQGAIASTTVHTASTFDLDGQALMSIRLH
ncbi:MAG: RibD family protein [Pseudomonadota bacterium]